MTKMEKNSALTNFPLASLRPNKAKKAIYFAVLHIDKEIENKGPLVRYSIL